MDEQTKLVIALFKELGVMVSIGGCGCCGSPWVKIVKDGKVIVDADNLIIDEQMYGL